jgi:hypothetical protein
MYEGKNENHIWKIKQVQDGWIVKLESSKPGQRTDGEVFISRKRMNTNPNTSINPLGRASLWWDNNKTYGEVLLDLSITVIYLAECYDGFEEPDTKVINKGFVVPLN